MSTALKRGEIALTIAHCSMQYSDPSKAKDADVKKIFSGAEPLGRPQIITGTEAGGRKSADLRRFLYRAAQTNDYTMVIPDNGHGDGWIAVANELIAVDHHFRFGFEEVVGAGEGEGGHQTRGITWASFPAELEGERLGRITVGASHYLRYGRRPGDANYALNGELIDAVGRWARQAGKGKDLVFYGCDTNINDRKDDTFRGKPLTSCWDELGKYQNTGAGPIDVIASYDDDVRVRCLEARALSDKVLDLHTDHLPVLARYAVKVLA